MKKKKKLGLIEAELMDINTYFNLQESLWCFCTKKTIIILHRFFFLCVYCLIVYDLIGKAHRNNIPVHSYLNSIKY